MATPEENAQAATDAIGAILAGGAVQRYRIGQRETQRYSLKEIREMQADAEWDAANANGGMFTPIRPEPAG